ncbi:MAG: rhodanese-like domain-containing protein [Methylococcaceae bacterium]|nr:rhodanese-like domain-containing protein [Methylococcaceae bacterium]
MIINKNPLEAWDFIQSNPEAILIDVRTKVEFSFIGHPINAIHIPWKEAPDWQINPHFISTAQQYLDNTNTPVLLLCRSGARSLAAANALAEKGYQNLINISEGFEGDLDAQKHRGTLGGWRYHNLPWEQT